MKNASWYLVKPDGTQTGLHESLSHAEGFLYYRNKQNHKTTKALNHFVMICHRCCIIVVVVVAVLFVALVVFSLLTLLLLLSWLLLFLVTHPEDNTRWGKSDCVGNRVPPVIPLVAIWSTQAGVETKLMSTTLTWLSGTAVSLQLGVAHSQTHHNLFAWSAGVGVGMLRGRGTTQPHSQTSQLATKPLSHIAISPHSYIATEPHSHIAT